VSTDELPGGYADGRGDFRAVTPWLLSPSALKGIVRRIVSVAVLVVIDIGGLVLGLYGALALRSYLVDPKPILWNLLWTHETDWLPFLVLLLVLVFSRGRLYAAREVREGAGRIVQSVVIVALIALAFAIGTGQHFTTFGLYAVATLFVAIFVSGFRWSYELASASVMRSLGVRRRTLLVGDEAQVADLRSKLGVGRGGIDYDFLPDVRIGPALNEALASGVVDEVIIADTALSEAALLDVVEAAHRDGVRVRIAPRTTELLLERGEYIPGQAVPLFELRPPVLAGADWAVKRAFDVVVALLIVIIGLPIWAVIALAIKLGSRGPVFYADRRVGLNEREFHMLKFRTMVAGAAAVQHELESANEASGALFKIRNDPRVTGVGKILRRFSLDEVPNVINVLRGEMSLVGPRPLPLRDHALLEVWHRRRSHVLPGMTGLWQIAGRSDLSFDDLVRLDFYYLENWSLWLDISILIRTLPAVVARRGAY
jgi:exopolysaccharide biosynthesis polyprenyl glycosylphosphotransferase